MEWLNKILEKVDGASDLYSDITKGIGKSFVPRNEFNEKNQKVKDLEQQVSDLQSGEDWETKFNELKTQYDSDVGKLRSELSQSKKDFKIEAKILESGVHKKSGAMKAFKALLDMDKIEIDDEGNIKGFDDQLEAIKKSDDYLFEKTVERRGTPPTPGDNNEPEESYGARLAKQSAKSKENSNSNSFRKTIGLE